MKKIIAITFIIFIVSCKKDASVKLPEIKPLPVISCFISPADTLIRLKLTWSMPLFEVQNNSVQIIPDAVVKINSVSGSAVLSFNAATNYYELKTISYPIQYGEKYDLSVELADGKTATAETTIPTGSLMLD